MDITSLHALINDWVKNQKPTPEGVTVTITLSYSSTDIKITDKTVTKNEETLILDLIKSEAFLKATGDSFSGHLSRIKKAIFAALEDSQYAANGLDIRTCTVNEFLKFVGEETLRKQWGFGKKYLNLLNQVLTHHGFGVLNP